MNTHEPLAALLREQIRRVEARVSGGLGVYSTELSQIQTAVDFVDRLRDRLDLGELVRDLNPGSGKPQVLLELRNAGGDPVVLKVYGRRRPNEAAVQSLWGKAGVPTAPILDSGDEPVSWLLMARLPGAPPATHSGFTLTRAIAAIMAHAHEVYRDDVGEPRNLYTGLRMHYEGVLASAAAHGYDVPADLTVSAAAIMGAGRSTFLHGDLAPVNLLQDGETLSFVDTCGYTGPAEFDAARWCARVGGAKRAVQALGQWLEVETALDPNLALQLLALELFMEAGVREIIKDEQGLDPRPRDAETLALLAEAQRLLESS